MTRSLPKKPKNWTWAWIVGIALVTAGLSWKIDLLHFDFRQAVGDMGEYAGRFAHPKWAGLMGYLVLMAQTVAIAFWGTFLALIIALGTCQFGSRSISSTNWGYRLVREYYSITRATPDAVYAVLLLMCFGLGPQAGVIALALHCGGFLGKSVCESLERVDRGVYEGLLATGCNRSQLLVFGGFPSVVREIGGFTLYTFDRNVRMAAALGIFGVGGIGVPLKDSLDRFRFDETSAILVVLLVSVLALESLSDTLRKRLD